MSFKKHNKGFRFYSLFAYGQTGSGKSYSIIGTKTNKGLVPQLVEGLFEQINKEKSSKDNQLEVK